jgi:excisionase family DNA binding protein
VRTPTSYEDRRASSTPLLDIAGVAERLAVSERFIRRLVFERRIPFLKIGHFVRFESVEIERWITETRVPEASR